MSLVCSAMDTLKKGRNEFISTHIDEYSRLLKCQLKLETKFPTIKFFDLSLHETMRRLLQNREYKFCEDMKKEFKVPDKRYYYLRLITLAEMNEWAEIERMSKTKKSPIGYEVIIFFCLTTEFEFIILLRIYFNLIYSLSLCLSFSFNLIIIYSYMSLIYYPLSSMYIWLYILKPFVDVCVQHRNPNEAQKYLPKIRDENKIKYCIKAGYVFSFVENLFSLPVSNLFFPLFKLRNLEEAAKYALRTKDIPALDYIMTKAGNNEQFLEKVRSMKSQLGS